MNSSISRDCRRVLCRAFTGRGGSSTENRRHRHRTSPDPVWVNTCDRCYPIIKLPPIVRSRDARYYCYDVRGTRFIDNNIDNHCNVFRRWSTRDLQGPHVTAFRSLRALYVRIAWCTRLTIPIVTIVIRESFWTN
jgi:hypothetical protein